MEIIIFQLLSCLYLYDSGIPVPVRIRKQIRYTGFWPVALNTVPPVYRILAVALIYQCRRYTNFWRRSEVCAKSVYRLLASTGLRVNWHFVIEIELITCFD